MSLGTLKAAQVFHQSMLKRIIRSPMSFFDTTPQGRIVNRFGKDVDVLDNTLPATMRTLIICLLSVTTTPSRPFWSSRSMN